MRQRTIKSLPNEARMPTGLLGVVAFSKPAISWCTGAALTEAAGLDSPWATWLAKVAAGAGCPPPRELTRP